MGSRNCVNLKGAGSGSDHNLVGHHKEKGRSLASEIKGLPSVIVQQWLAIHEKLRYAVGLKVLGILLGLGRGAARVSTVDFAPALDARCASELNSVKVWNGLS